MKQDESDEGYKHALLSIRSRKSVSLFNDGGTIDETSSWSAEFCDFCAVVCGLDEEYRYFSPKNVLKYTISWNRRTYERKGIPSRTADCSLEFEDSSALVMQAYFIRYEIVAKEGDRRRPNILMPPYKEPQDPVCSATYHSINLFF